MNRVSNKTIETLAAQLPLASVLEKVVRQDLRNFVIQQGMVALTGILEAERTALCGEAYERNGVEARRAGTAQGSLVMGGRKVGVKRPRVRDDSGEISLPSYLEFSERDPLDARALEQMVIGVSTRKYSRSLEAVPEEFGPSGTSKSSVSRRFIAATKKQIGDCLNRSLLGMNIECLMIDGIHLGDHLVVIAVGIASDGEKHVLGFWEGSTENAAVCSSLLTNLVERGLSTAQSRLFVIDGGKALRTSIRKIFGKRSLVQRCQIHKVRNVVDHLPKELHGTIRQAMREAYASKSFDIGKRRLLQLVKQLEEDHPGAAASLREGLDETLTIKRFGLSRLLERSLASTNIIESLNSSVRLVTGRVKVWKSGTMVLRWVATAVIDELAPVWWTV